MSTLSSYKDCPQVLRDYLFYLLTIKGRSSRTVDAYYTDLRTFFRFLIMHKNLCENEISFEKLPLQLVTLDILKSVTLSDAYEYLHYISSDRSNSPKTRSRKVSSLKSFFHYLCDKTHLIQHNPMAELEVPAVKKSLPKYLSLEQCLSLLQHIDGDYKERDYCIITFFLNCGMRLSELCGIDLTDIKEDTIKILGKGNKERIIYLNDACVDALKNYLTFRNTHKIDPQDRNALFLNRNGRRLGARRVEQIVDEQLKKAGLDRYGFSVHKLRHTAATMMYQYGNVDIRVLQEILGHSNLGTTQIYTHISNDQMEHAVQSTPLSHMKISKLDKKE